MSEIGKLISLILDNRVLVESYSGIARSAKAELDALLAENTQLMDTNDELRTENNQLRTEDHEWRKLRARNEELEKYHGFYMGKPVPEGDETLSEINCLRADLDEAIRVIKDFDDLRLATIREFGHANGLDGDPKYITAAAFLARMKGETK